MSNCNKTPNHFRHNRADGGSHGYFGAVHSVTPISIPGEGHRPHVSIHFRGGYVLDLTPADAADLARRLPAVIAYLPVVPDVSGALANLEGIQP